MDSSKDFMRCLIAKYPDLPVMVVSFSFPDWLVDHPGRILYLGADYPPAIIKSKDFHYYYAPTSKAVVDGLSGSAMICSEPYGLIFIDHDHKLTSLIEQIRSVKKFASCNTAFIFDDAVPPKVDMAGPKPTQAWWVGEVWILPHIIWQSNENFFCICTDLKPTGLMACVAFDLLEKNEIDRVYKQLAEINTDEKLSKKMNLSNFVDFSVKIETQIVAFLREGMVGIVLGSDLDDKLFSSEIISQQSTWIRPAPSFVVDLASDDRDLSSLHRTDWVAPGKQVDTFQDAYILGFDSIIVDGRYFSRWCFTSDSKLNRIAVAFGSYDNQHTSLKKIGSEYFLPKGRLQNSINLQEKIFFATPDEPDNWGMWILLAIPSVKEFLLNRNKYTKFMIDLKHQWQSNLIDFLGVRPDELIPHNREEIYHADQVSLIRKSFRNLYVDPDEREHFIDLANNVSQLGREVLPRRVFVSRLTRTRKLGSYRGLINEEELIEGLERLGFVAIEPEFFSFPKQIALFNNAEIVVGLGGAAMFNVVFCRPGTKLITIESGIGFVGSHANIFASIGLEYGVILGEEDPSDSRKDQRRWHLNVPRALEQIALFLEP